MMKVEQAALVVYRGVDRALKRSYELGEHTWVTSTRFPGYEQIFTNS